MKRRNQNSLIFRSIIKLKKLLHLNTKLDTYVPTKWRTSIFREQNWWLLWLLLLKVGRLMGVSLEVCCEWLDTSVILWLTTCINLEIVLLSSRIWTSVSFLNSFKFLIASLIFKNLVPFAIIEWNESTNVKNKVLCLYLAVDREKIWRNLYSS